MAEAFPWRPGSAFVYTVDNHNSVLGMREEALAGGAAAAAVVPGTTASGALPPPQANPPVQMQLRTSSLRSLAWHIHLQQSPPLTPCCRESPGCSDEG